MLHSFLLFEALAHAFSPLVPWILSLEMSRESLEMNAGHTHQTKEDTLCDQRFSMSCNIA